MESEKVKSFLNRKIFNDLDKELITDNQINQINKILEVYDNKSIKNRLKNIHDFIKYDVEGDWVERLHIIQNVLKNDVMSNYAMEIRYGKDNIEEIKKNLFRKISHSKDIYIEKFGEIEGNKKWDEFKEKSKTPWGLNACIEKFGEIDGPKKWDERLTKKINTMQSRKKIKKYNNGQTLKEYQDRYGEEKGLIKWTEKNEKISYVFSKEYYIDTFGEEEGLIKWREYCKNMDKTSLKSFINREGEEIGTEKYNEHIKKMKYVRSKEYFIEKYGYELGIDKFNDLFIKRRFKNSKYSKISQSLFWEIYSKYNGTEEIYFAELNEEYLFYIFDDNLIYIELDFKCGDKVIEFDGDYWHQNEKQQEKDKLKDKHLISNGYQVLRVKESDYKKNKEKIVNECLLFLNKK
jgi:hypothetical protein